VSYNDPIDAITRALTAQPLVLEDVKVAVERAYAEGLSAEKIRACFATREAWRKFRRTVTREYGGFTQPKGCGVVIAGKMWPIDVSDQEHPDNRAAREALAADGRSWGLVWSFRHRLQGPTDIGPCGLRERAGFFTCAYRPIDPVVRKHQPVDD